MSHTSVLRYTVNCLSCFFHEMQYALSVVLPYLLYPDLRFCLPPTAVVEGVLWCLWSLCMSLHNSDGQRYVLAKQRITVQFSAWSKRLSSLSPNVWTGCGAHLLFKVYVGFLLWEPSGQGVKLSRLAQRLRMSGAIPILPPYAFMVCTCALFTCHYVIFQPQSALCATFVLHRHWFCHACQVIVSKKE
jgi:hypothetical protein